jgi:hypothetical protein
LVTIKEITAQPAVVEAGGKILLSVAFVGILDRVLLVKASFREANNLDYMLNDQGINGDEKAGDNIWSCAAEIPANVPARQFHFDFLCLNTDLNRIYIKGTVKQGIGEQGSLTFTVK